MNNNNDTNTNNSDLYYDDNSFNENGIDTVVENNSPQFPSANRGNPVTNFGRGFAEGFKNGLNPQRNNPALGVGANKDESMKGPKKPDSKGSKPSDDKNNPAKGQKDGNKKNNPLPGGMNKDKNDNNKNDNHSKPQDKNKGFGSKINSFNRGLLGSKLGFGKKNDSKDEDITGLGLTSNKKLVNFLSSKLSPLKLKIVLSLLPVVFIIFLLIAVIVFVSIIVALIGSLFSFASEGSSSYCGGSDYDLSVLDSNPPSYTYTDVFNINWSKSSSQFKTLSSLETYADEDGFLRSGDSYFIALGSYFGIETDGEKKLVMGTKYLIKLKNGTEFVGILADAKADAHTTESSQHSQHIYDKSVIEFEMACGSKINPNSYGFNFSGDYNTSCSGAQSAINKKFSGEIESISLLDDSGASCTYDNGEFPIRTKYFSQSDMNKIFAVSPGAKTQKKYYPFECVTYAKLRAVEILLTATNISDEYRKKAIAAIDATHGNGGDWHAPSNSGLKKFNYDTTCTKPKAGSLISWKSNSVYGHVGIIEAVNGDKVIVTDGYNSSHFNYYEISIDKLSTLGNIYKKCYGITYLFEYNG